MIGQNLLTMKYTHIALAIVAISLCFVAVEARSKEGVPILPLFLFLEEGT